MPSVRPTVVAPATAYTSMAAWSVARSRILVELKVVGGPRRCVSRADGRSVGRRGACVCEREARASASVGRVRLRACTRACWCVVTTSSDPVLTDFPLAGLINAR